VSNKKQSKEATVSICPRCGMEIDYVSEERRGDRVYVYAVHVTRLGKKRRVKKCYLGPVDKYEYAERLVQLDLTNILDLDFMRVVERAVENFINAAKNADSKELAKYISAAEKMSIKLVELAERLDKLIGELERVIQVEQSS
jgi:hypothetical protein